MVHKGALNPPSVNKKLIILLPSVSDYKHVSVACSINFCCVENNNIAKIQALRNKQGLTTLLISYTGGQLKSVSMALHTLSEVFFPGWTILNSLMITSIPPVGILCNIGDNWFLLWLWDGNKYISLKVQHKWRNKLEISSLSNTYIQEARL